MKKTITIICFLVLTVNVFSAENRGVTFETYLNEELAKLVVLPEDKMELEAFAYSVKMIKFKQITTATYTLVGLKQMNNEAGLNRLRILFISAGEKPYNHYTRFLQLWKSAWDNRSREDTDNAVKELKLAAEAFNAALASELLRKRITTAYRDVMRPTLEKELRETYQTQAVVEQEQREFEGIQNEYSSRKMFFVGGYYHLFWNGMGAGVRVGGYFSPALKSLNFGIFLNGSYTKSNDEVSYLANTYKFKNYYYGIDLLFAGKLHWHSFKHSMHIGIGLSAVFRDGGAEDNVYLGGTVKFKSQGFGLIYELGYLFLFSKHNFGLSINYIYKVMYIQKRMENTFPNASKMDSFFGLSVGFLFNMM